MNVKRAAIIAAFLVAAASPAPAHGAFPGRDGRIAYTSDWEPTDCGDHSCEEVVLGLNTIRPDGTGRRPIGRCGRRSVACEEREAAWSPDGRRIVLVHDDAIWVMRADGSRAHRVFAGSADTPSWSPDGRHIVFDELTSFTGWITIMRPDGSHRRRISPTDDNSDPTWSVRGLIAYTHYQPYFTGHTSIVTRRADGRLVSRFKERGSDVTNPDFSPDGKLVAFERYDNNDGISIWASRPDGSHLRRVVADGLSPAWSPSGRFIAYSGPVQSYPRDREIFVARSNGSHAHQLGPSRRQKGDRRGDYGEPSWQPLPRR
jgi:Tol biopolymer transport system component